MDWGSILTGGIYGGGGTTQDAMGLASGYSPVAKIFGVGQDTPNNYDANANLEDAKKKAGRVYDQAMGGPPSWDLKGDKATAQTVTAPGAIQAQTIQTPGMLGGQEATDLRTQQLAGATDLLNSPSAARAQFAAAQQRIGGQQMAQAAGARGADRAAARRDAMLATGKLGMQAGADSAALAAQEDAQKRAAYNAALGNVRAGDVSGAQAQTQIAAANQGANLQAQTTTAQQQLQAGLANQQANLAAQQSNQQYSLGGFNALNAAEVAKSNVALGALGAQNQATGIAAGYGANQNEAETKANAGIIGGLGGLIGGLGKLSDVRTKEEVAPVGTSAVDWSEDYDKLMKNLYLKGPSATGNPELQQQEEETDPFERYQAQTIQEEDDGSEDASKSEFLSELMKGDANRMLDKGKAAQANDDYLRRLMSEAATKEPTPALSSGSGNAKLNPFHEITPFRSTPTWDMSTTGGGYLPAGSGGTFGNLDDSGRMPPYANRPYYDKLASLSDERAKEAVEKMDDKDLSAWADKVTELPITWRYKDGFADSGKDAHVGVPAQKLEQTGPLGELLVHEGPDGYKRVDYGQAALMLGVALQRQMRKQKGANTHG